ncbi:hypothetical protein HORIV_66600 [Vreelandella olivaria]|uniref:Uncharacterized protein n=1 Tax=Vreelandella olivaria TaxID=390919 RepID=A0ABN5X4Q6_9GAMM|nr:hypothetical protein HORIV_66600 [Halomonas olivaria]
MVNESAVFETHLSRARLEINLLSKEKPPAALRETIHVVFEDGHTFDAVAFGLFFTPVPSTFVASVIENLGILLGTQRLFDGHMVVDKKCRGT